MTLTEMLKNLLFPPKCVLCGRILERQETDLCRTCRVEAPVLPKPSAARPFLKRWTALWPYRDTVRRSVLRYKFHGCRAYAPAYGRLLGMKLLEDLPEGWDVLTWVPVSRRRKLRRGYDQVELLARAVGRETGTAPVRTLKKIRHNPPQSGLEDQARRRANVLGAYAAVNRDAFAGKRVLLLDDVITTGATMGECARVLLTAGAKEVYGGALAAARHETKNKQ